jgi:VWFA-related protein
MYIATRFGSLLLLALVCTAAGSAQQASSAGQSGHGEIVLDVVVAPKSGRPVADLQQQDFTLLDNKGPQPILAFRTVTGRQTALEVIVVIDAVNADYQTVSFERLQIDKFLRMEGGRLTYPTALAIVTDKGIQMLGDFSSDGNALGAALDRDDVGLRQLDRSSGYYGAAERLQLSLNALNQLVASEAPRPGRKVMLWVSPGWPLLSGPNTELDSKQQQQIFGNIVALSTQLLEGHVTVYSVNPVGAGESVVRASYYKEFLKGVSKPGQVSLGNLGLPVLAIQSGGLALDFTNDVAGALQTCVADTAPYYELSFAAPSGERPDEYHPLEIKIAKPGLTARTRQGYYAQPSSHN